jgi:membrane protein YqaA with SNARE-associated domain
VIATALRPGSSVRPFAQWLLGRDLPALPTDRRDDTVEFVVRRMDELPSPLALGVGIIAVVLRWLVVVPGGTTLAATLTRLPVPGVSEYVRLIRSLARAFVWEQWPDTAPSGAPA